MADTHVRYSFPDPLLFDVVAVIGEIAILGEGRVQDLVPPEMAVISIALSGRWMQGLGESAMSESAHRVMLHGPTSSASWMAGEGGIVIAIALHPLVWPLLFGRKAELFADRSVPLFDVLGDKALELLSALSQRSTFESRVVALNEFLKSLPRKVGELVLPQQIMLMRLALADPDCASVEDMASRVGISQSRLSRLATTSFGFTPKLLIRIARFRRMLHRADAHSYTVWREFIEGQYVDQSHLIRDFQRFLGMSPSTYFALERPFVKAAFAEARRLLGQTPLEGDMKLAAE